MTITATRPELRPARTDIDDQAIRLAGLLLVAGVWVEREVARRLRTFLGGA